MKRIILILTFIALSVNIYAQEDKTVTLTVTGQGQTQEEAKQNALRYAIEQAFGTFISSNTEILNDELVKDEIVSISNGNIQKFDVISEVKIPDGGYATTLKAIVSVSKLTSFVESKGGGVEFQGSLFGANLRQQKMNENAELKAILNLCEVSNQILSKSLDYSIEVGEPVKAGVLEWAPMSLWRPQDDDYQVLLTVKMYPNKNFDQFLDYFYSSIKSIAMPTSEQSDYLKLNKTIYYLTINKNEKYFFRNSGTVIALQNLFLKSNQYLLNFKVITNLGFIPLKTCCHYVDDHDSQNIYNHPGRPAIWHLNADVANYSSRGSRNHNSGFPKFSFNIAGLGADRNNTGSSWRTYYEYIYWLTSHEVLFDSEDYFLQTGKFYCENTQVQNGMKILYPEYPYRIIPSVMESIGDLSLSKIEYTHKYLAVYSEEDLLRLSKISVEQLK